MSLFNATRLMTLTPCLSALKIASSMCLLMPAFSLQATMMLPMKLLLLYAFLFNLAFRPDHTVDRRLLNLLDRKVPPSSTPFHGVTSSDITGFGSSPDLWIRLYTPVFSTEVVRLLPVVVFFHGGGFVFGSPASVQIDSFTRDFARKLSSIVVSVNYRLAPEHRYPCQYEDGFHVLKVIDEGLISHSLPQNADLSRSFVAGESAGGNIAHHVTVRASKYRFKSLKIAGMIAIQPFFGGEKRTESELRYANNFGLTLEMTDWFWKAFLPVGSNRDHPAANVVGSKAVDVSGLNFPATLVIIGGLDPLSDRNKEYGEWLKKSGKEVEIREYPNATHGFSWFSNVPEYPQLLRDAVEFVENHKHANPDCTNRRKVAKI